MEGKHYFEEIRTSFCEMDEAITKGKMMRSDALHYKGKVFAFFSTKGHMVFKLGKDFDISAHPLPLAVFSPFKSKKPLSGWFQLSFDDKNEWHSLTKKALQHIQSLI